MIRVFVGTLLVLLSLSSQAAALSYDGYSLSSTVYIYDSTNSAAYGCDRQHYNMYLPAAPATNTVTGTCSTAVTHTSTATLQNISSAGFSGTFSQDQQHNTSATVSTADNFVHGAAKFSTTITTGSATDLVFDIDWSGLEVDGLEGQPAIYGGAGFYAYLKSSNGSVIWTFREDSQFGGAQQGLNSDIVSLAAGTYDFYISLGVKSKAYSDIGTLSSTPTMNFNVTAVPLPAAVWLFGSALAGLGWMRRKQTV
jgi:hypothetical protein